MYEFMLSSGLVDRGLRLRIPDVSPHLWQASSEVAASNVASGDWLLLPYVPDTISTISNSS